MIFANSFKNKFYIQNTKIFIIKNIQICISVKMSRKRFAEINLGINERHSS